MEKRNDDKYFLDQIQNTNARDLRIYFGGPTQLKGREHSISGVL